MSVGPNQHGSGRSDCAKYRKLPDTSVFGVDQLNPIRPWGDVEAAGLIEVEYQFRTFRPSARILGHDQ